MRHIAVKIKERLGYAFRLEFDNGETRWVDLEKIITLDPRYAKYKGKPYLLDEASISRSGGLEFKTLLGISGPTLYHMGQLPIPVAPPETVRPQTGLARSIYQRFQNLDEENVNVAI